jgi:hypothetical protein
MPAPASHPRVARRRFLAHRAPIPDGAAIAPLTGSGTEMKSSDGHSKAPPNKAKTLSQECKSKCFKSVTPTEKLAFLTRLLERLEFSSH